MKTESVGNWYKYSNDEWICMKCGYVKYCDTLDGGVLPPFCEQCGNRNLPEDGEVFEKVKVVVYDIHDILTNDIITRGVSSNNGLNALKTFLRDYWGELPKNYSFAKNKEGLWTARHKIRMSFICRPRQV